ncbi:hypothetical protein K439DRAFT_1385101 [Ramaria rubella]|nr:hypothetical protein K439DRAFT_1385101 [Ramaria rubella]
MDGPCQSISKKSPLLFMRVCSRWRRIAISSPCLWTICHGSSKQLCHALPLWLSNSSSLPIDVAVYPSDGLSSTLSRIIVENFGRFYSFRGHFICLNGVQPPIEAPCLQFLALASYCDEPPKSLKGCINAPRLTGLGIQTMSLADIVSFPAHCLQTLNLNLVGNSDGQTPSEALHFLATFSNITMLSIELSSETQFHLEGHAHVVLPLLHTLNLDYSDDRDIDHDPSSLLCLIRAPVLKRLTIGYCSGNDIDSDNLLSYALEALFEEHPPLQELLVIGLKVSHFGISRTLSCGP